MTKFNDLHETLVGSMTFPLSSTLMNRRGIRNHYQNSLKAEKTSPEDLEQLQLKKLKKLFQYAYESVPFYKKRFDEAGFSPDEFKTLSDMECIPPLTRQEVIENRHQMVNSQLADSIPVADASARGPAEPVPFALFKKHKLVRNTSSGSTGAPTIFYEDGSATALNWAHELRFRKWYGIDPGAREARLMRITADYLPKSAAIRLRKVLWNQLILPGVNLQEPEYALNVKRLNEFKPQVMWGFTSALTGLAEYIKQSGATCHKPKIAIGWAAPIYDHERRLLAEVFECPISNIYGSREVGHVAAQCREGTFHINQDNYLVETIPAEDVDHSDGTGELLVTPLVNVAMPFIRYKMGDIGKISRSQCSCGLPLQELQQFLGRTGEIFKTRDGRMISPNFWCRTFMDIKLADSIKRFQVVYLKDGNVRIKLVTNENYSKDTEEHFVNHLQRNFQKETQFHFDYVDEIKPQLSGKYQMVMKED